MRYAIVACAGALGAVARYGVGLTVGVASFPWATLIVNVVGSALLGFVLAVEPRWNTDVVAAVGIGFLGAFTTFSTFSADTLALVRDGRAGVALGYVSASLVLALAGCAAGYALGRAG